MKEKLNLDYINEMLNNAKFDSEKFQTIMNFLSYVYYSETSALFVYPGSKLKMNDELNDVFDLLHADKVSKTSKGYTTFVDTFGGALNSTLVLMESLKTSGITKFIANDIDTCLITAHSDTKDNKDALVNEFSEIIRLKFIKKYGTFVVDNKTFESITKEIINEFEELQIKGEFGVKTSIRFIILRGLEFSGILKYYKHKDGGGHKFSGKLYDYKKLFSWIFNQIPKIEKFSSIYNVLDIEFRNKDCFNLFNDLDIKDNPDVIMNLDPPYLESSKKSIEESTLLQMNSADLKECVQNYNTVFPHIDLLKMLPKFNFIYNNNTNPIVSYYAKSIKSSLLEFGRNNVLASKKGQKNTIVHEDIFFNNSLLK